MNISLPLWSFYGHLIVIVSKTWKLISFAMEFQEQLKGTERLSPMIAFLNQCFSSVIMRNPMRGGISGQGVWEHFEVGTKSIVVQAWI